MTRRRWLIPAALGVAMLIAAAEFVHAQAPASADSAEKELQQNESILLDANATPQARDQAAQRLVSRSSKEADAILLSALTDRGNREARLAVAKALGGASNPKPTAQFINPLSQLLGDDQELTAAAAKALATYRDTADLARKELTQFVTNRVRPIRSRTVAIRAMGRLVDRLTAEVLVGLLRDENALIRDAAMDALTEMTGFTSFGRDRQRWTRWWNETRGSKDAEWATDLLNKNADRAAKLQARIDSAREELARMIGDEYQRATPEEQIRKIQAHLQSDSEDARWAAVSVLYRDIREKSGINTPPDLLVILRGMIGDSSAAVRAETARALAEANDAAAVDALLAQLAQENDPDVQAAIFRALGPMHDLRAVKPLLGKKGLMSDSFAVARAAAESLKSLAGNLRDEKNAAEAAQVSEALLQRLASTSDPSAEGLRAAVVEALAALGPRPALRTFQTLCMSSREQAQVRRYAVRGLATIGDPESANTVVEVLRDPDRGVRLEALDALAKLARFENAEAIGRLISSAEPDTSVRDKAWEVLSALFEKASPDDLRVWAGRFKADTDTDHKRRMRIFQVLEKKLATDQPSKELASCRQNLGIELLRLDRADEAAAEFREALQYWKSAGDDPSADYAMQLLMEALLRSRKYADAAKFAADAIGVASANATSMWLKINGEIERLKKERDYDSILLLIDEVKKIPLGSTQKSQLPSIEESIRELKKKQTTTGGRTWVRQENRHEHAENGFAISA